MIKMGDWFYVTYAARHFSFGQFWIPEVRQRYVKPDVPAEFPHYLKTNATLTGLAMTKESQDLDPPRLADGPAPGRPRRDPISGEDRRPIRDVAAAAGMGGTPATAPIRPARGSALPTT